MWTKTSSLQRHEIEHRRGTVPFRQSAVERHPPLTTYISTVEAAAYLGVSRQFLEQDRTGRRQIPYFKFGAAVRYLRCDLDEWANKQRRDAYPLADHFRA